MKTPYSAPEWTTEWTSGFSQEVDCLGTGVWRCLLGGESDGQGALTYL